jgi:hypothetical protein
MLRLLRACEVPWPLPFLPWRHPVFAGSWNDPPRRILCAKTARLGGRYTHVSSAPKFLCFCEPSRLTIPTFGRRADDRRLPLMWPESRADFGGHRVLGPSTAGEQPKPRRSAGGNRSNRSLRSTPTPFRRERVAAARFRAVLVVFLRWYALWVHVRLCSCAGRSHPSHSTSQAM